VVCAVEDIEEIDDRESDEVALERKRCRVNALDKERGLRNWRYSRGFVCASAILNGLFLRTNSSKVEVIKVKSRSR
jgi:hypothetical protein